MMAIDRKQLAALRKQFAALPTHTSRIRAAMQHLGRFCYDDLDYLVPSESEKSIRAVISQLLQDGETRRTDIPGTFEYVPKPRRRILLDIIWHLVRSHRQFTTDEIERLSSANRYTVLEYLRCLRDFGYLREAGGGAWHLILDPGPETPVNTVKCSKLKRLRQMKKEEKANAEA